MTIVDRHLPAGNTYNKPEFIVVHAMGEYIDNRGAVENEQNGVFHAPDWLRVQGVSAHILVDNDGALFRCRSDHEGAYHAKEFNTNSLGIEFLVRGRHDYITFLEAIKTDYVTHAQWGAGIEQVRIWMGKYGISTDKVFRHSDLSPGRKFDPGAGFDWDAFVNHISS